MLTKPYFIIKDQQSLSSVPDDKNNDFIFLIEIDFTRKDDIVETYKKIFNTGINRFCLLLKPTGAFTELQTAVEYLISLSFHINYERPVLNELLVFVEFPDNIFQDHFRNQAISHGYQAVNFKNIKNLLLITDIHQAEEEYYSFLKGSVANEYDVIVNLSTPANAGLISLVQQYLVSAENRIQANDPVLYSLHAIHASDIQTIERLNNTIRQYKEIVESKNSYASGSSGFEAGYRKQITEIANFYNNEYEILPLWYKKLGHLIKVLTGKRTLKSLFNDNVKKYKN